MTNKLQKNKQATLFPTLKDSNRALIIGIELLKGNELKKDEQGYSLIEDLCQAIVKKDGSFSYINRNHVVEFFFKDVDQKILISGTDKIKYKEIRYVCPPKILYFGTVENFIPRMRLNGIRSNTKGYIKLYDSEKEACEFATKFAQEGEKTVAIKIDAERAFTEGLRFSTFKEHEYIVVQLHKEYVIG